MAEVISLLDGRNETVLDERGFLELVGEYMGGDARRWLEDWLGENDEVADYIDGLEKEAEGLRARHREAMAELRKESEAIAGMVHKKEIDRAALSRAAGNIGRITWRGVNGL